MKKLLFSLLCSAAVLSASAINYRQAREYAYFLTDKMAYELNLTTEQYERAYQVNLDYLLSVDNRSHIDGNYWTYRDTDLRFILFDWQYNLYRAMDYFYRPVVWSGSGFSFSIYTRYGNSSFYYDRPTVFYNYAGTHWSNRSYATESPYCGQIFDGRRGGMRGSYAPHVSYRNAYGYTNGYDRPRRGTEYANGNGYSNYNYQRYDNGTTSYRYGNNGSSYEVIGDRYNGSNHNNDGRFGRQYDNGNTYNKGYNVGHNNYNNSNNNSSWRNDNNSGRDKNLPSRYNNYSSGTVYGETWVDSNLNSQQNNSRNDNNTTRSQYVPSRTQSNGGFDHTTRSSTYVEQNNTRGGGFTPSYNGGTTRNNGNYQNTSTPSRSSGTIVSGRR